MANITEDNFLVWNQGRAPLVGYNFMLRVELAFDLPCKRVQAFTREMEYELIQEGGLNDYVHMRRKPNSKPFYFEVERYVGVDYFDPLPVGAELVLPVILMVSHYQNQFIPFLVARTFVFTGCRVIKKTFGELSAEDSGLATEITTIAYNEMLCVDLPWASADALNFNSGPVTNDPTNSKSDEESKDESEESDGEPVKEGLEEPDIGPPSPVDPSELPADESPEEELEEPDIGPPSPEDPSELPADEPTEETESTEQTDTDAETANTGDASADSADTDDSDAEVVDEGDAETVTPDPSAADEEEPVEEEQEETGEDAPRNQIVKQQEPGDENRSDAEKPYNQVVKQQNSETGGEDADGPGGAGEDSAEGAEN